jgi:hypothetical protein
VDFILIGGVAAAAHGSPRTTLDLDVVYSREPENIRRLVSTLAPLHPYPRGAPSGLPFLWDEQTVQRGLNFTLVTDLGDLDVMGEIVGGGGYTALAPHTEMISVLEVTVRCLDLPTLIHVKRAAGRPKDLESLALLEAVLEEQQRQS